MKGKKKFLGLFKKSLRCKHIFKNITRFLGLFLILQFLYSVFLSFYHHFLCPIIDFEKKYGKWAVITGATDGIGKAMAIELGKTNMNLLLISRTKEKLEQTKEEIHKICPNIQIDIYQLDCSQLDNSKIRSELKNRLEKIADFGILINNVGVSYNFPKYYHELSDDEISTMISLNISATLWFTKLTLPLMRVKQCGAIINISSASARLCTPLLTVYGASKCFIEHYTASLAAEYADQGILIQAHSPMFVATKLAKIRRSSFFIPTPETYAKSAIACIGYETLACPYWTHELLLWVYTHLPSKIIVGYTKTMFLAKRRTALGKEKKDD